MKIYLRAFAMCQSMFCAIPFPGNVWDDEARDKMLLFLPVVGLEIGVIWGALAWVCRAWSLPVLIRGLVTAVCPWLAAGFIHLDGYMDVTDAVGSYRSPERRREILKDSHVGAFAVIGMVLLALAQFAFLASVKETANPWILILVPAVSRCCSALAVTGLKSMNTSQYAAQRKSKTRLAVHAAMLAGLVAAGFLLWGKGGFVLLGCMAGYSLALRNAYRALEGMNGDVSGYALTIGELAAAAVYSLL